MHHVLKNIIDIKPHKKLRFVRVTDDGHRYLY